MKNRKPKRKVIMYSKKATWGVRSEDKGWCLVSGFNYKPNSDSEAVPRLCDQKLIEGFVCNLREITCKDCNAIFKRMRDDGVR